METKDIGWIAWLVVRLIIFGFGVGYSFKLMTAKSTIENVLGIIALIALVVALLITFKTKKQDEKTLNRGSSDSNSGDNSNVRVPPSGSDGSRVHNQ